MATKARTVALTVFHDVCLEDAYANLAVPKALKQARLNKADAAFATELVYGTIRHQNLYDQIIGSISQRDANQLDAIVRDALRMGIHQLLNMRVASHAAINETVDMVKYMANPGAAKFANAILRKASQRSAQEWVDMLGANKSPEERLALATSHPLWIVRAYRESLRHCALEDELEEALDINNTAPYVHLVARPGLITYDDLADQVEYRLDADVAPTALSKWGMMISGGDPGRLAAVRDGRAAVEDQGSQLVAAIAATAPLSGKDNGTWLDMCAGPGGKAALMACLGAPDATLDAWELHPARAALVKDSCRQLTNVAVTTGDSTAITTDKTYDRVLADVPCSGLGSLRRRPELRWRERRDDIPVMTQLQYRLLERACDLVRPGGIVAYSTCSPVVAETIDVVSRLLDNRSDMMALNTKDIACNLVGEDLRDTLGASDTPHVQLWPHRHESDAMFCAVLQRKDNDD